MFAHKRTWRVGLALLLAALFLVLGASALAAETDPIEFTMEINPSSLTAPGEVKVSLRVANTGSEDMVDPVTLYDPDGKVVASFGDGGSYILSAGSFRTWEGAWNVTQEQLDAGEFSYTVKYHLPDENGELVEMSRSAVAQVNFTGERVRLSVSRTITPEVARSGSTVSVVYELYNSGNVDLTDIQVKEKIARTAQTVKSLPAGQKSTLTFTSKIGNADLASSASITYKAKGSTKTLKETVAVAAIPLAKPNLSITLSSPAAGVNIGEAATLIVTFENKGNVSYSNVTVSDAKKGEILSNLSIPAGATVTEQKEFILTEPTTFKVTATLPDNTGATKTLTTDALTIGVFDPEKTLLLTLNLTCDHETIDQSPADVRFTLNITNNSNIKAENIAISHGATAIATIAALEPGASETLVRDVRVAQAGKFRFTATVKDSMQNTVTFDSNTLQLTYAAPTAAPTTVPVVTVAPPVLVTAAPAAPLLENTRSVLLTLLSVVGVLFGACLLLFLVSTVLRIRNKSKSAAAYDHLELAERRDYTEPAQENADENDEDDEAPAQEDALPTDAEEERLLPHEKLIQKEAEPEAPAAEPVPEPEKMPASDGEGGYRISRAEPSEAAQPVDAPAEKAAEAAQAPAESKPRRHRSQRAQRTEDGE